MGEKLPEFAKRNLKELVETRKSKGLTQTQLSKLSGVSEKILSKYEKEQVKRPDFDTYNKIAKVFNWKKIKVLEKEIFYEKDEKPFLIPNREFTFEIGKRYQIDGKNIYSEFLYVEKRGKHHVFRNVLGGWEMTLTDAQLVGKTFMEVNEK